MQRRRSQKGFTLAESLAASVILAVAVVGVSGALVASQQQSGVHRRTHALTMLAQQLMERVTALPMTKDDGTTGVAGWPTVKDFKQYDTLDDFAGYTDVVDASPAMEIRTGNSALLTPSDVEPTPLTTSQATAAAGAAVTREVAISYPTSAFGAAVNAGDVAVVRVTVRFGAKQSLMLTQLVCRWTSARGS